MAEITDSHPETNLPLPMKSEQFVEEFLAKISETQYGDEIGIATMQLETQVVADDSLVCDVLIAMIEAKKRGADARVIVDHRYVSNMTRIGNRDYPDWLPIVSPSKRAERTANKGRTATWLTTLRENEMLVEALPHTAERGYVPRLRHMGSFHPAQRVFATRHMKAAYIANTGGDSTAWINSANMTDSDLRRPDGVSKLGMNNLSLRLDGKAAAFVVKAVNNDFSRGAGLHTYSDGVMLVHDVGN